MRILYPIRKYDINEVRDYSMLVGHDLTFEHIYIDNYVEYIYLSPHQLDCLYREGHRGLRDLYQEIERKISNYSALWIRHGSLFHPEFISAIKVRGKVLLTTDDPEGSYLDTFPYCKFYDLVIHAAVYYDANTKMQQKLREWGARETHWMPLGVYSWRYRTDWTKSEILNYPKDIDILFVGAGYEKDSFILALKKHFGRRMRIFGHWGGRRGFMKRIFKNGIIDYIKPLEQHRFIETHLRSKIGINKHISYGPSNQRQFILPANGVLQITDLPQQTCEVFDTSREVRCYKNVASAIQLCEYYLTYVKERREITENAFDRVMSDYIFTKNLLSSVNRMKKIF